MTRQEKMREKNWWIHLAIEFAMIIAAKFIVELIL